MGRTAATTTEYRKAIRAARAVFCSPRFGCSEKQVKISKADALWLVRGLSKDITPKDHGMPCEHFGYWDNNDFIVG